METLVSMKLRAKIFYGAARACLAQADLELSLSQFTKVMGKPRTVDTYSKVTKSRYVLERVAASEGYRELAIAHERLHKKHLAVSPTMIKLHGWIYPNE